MPIPLFTTSEKPNTAETQTSPTNPAAVTSTPLTSGSNLPARRRSSASEGQHHHHHQEAANASGTATSAASSGRERTREEREAADRLYEERIEEEYAKREGGA
ncbi:hypothetical protein DFP73DRAFT_327126 [Morchella snyderi]|nr:hypothetical protein DFP73DRAFT_327126 [Morchella snyderi]